MSAPGFSGFSPAPRRRTGFRRNAVAPASSRDDQRELCLATAWRLVEDGQTVLIFCPERRSVEPFADVIVDLHERGALRSLLEAEPPSSTPRSRSARNGSGRTAPSSNASALASRCTTERCRPPIARRLSACCATTSSRSPSLRRRWRRASICRPRPSSCTPSTALGERIEISEFKNVIGRAGRAYVDVEGIVLFPMFDNIAKKRRNWEASSTISARAIWRVAWCGWWGAFCLACSCTHRRKTSINSSTMSSITPPLDLPRNRERKARGSRAGPCRLGAEYRDARHGDPQPHRRKRHSG